MSIIDPISDMLTRMRNVIMRQGKEVLVPASRFKSSVLTCLETEGYIESFETVKGDDGHDWLNIKLKYTAEGKSVIHSMTRKSKPSLRQYISFDDLRPVLKNGVMTRIISTHQNVMSDRLILKNKYRMGGELLFVIE